MYSSLFCRILKVTSRKEKTEPDKTWFLLWNVIRAKEEEGNDYFLFIVVQLFICVPTLCNPVDCSMPGFSVLHHLLELAQTPVHWIGDAIQPSHPLSSPSPPALSLPQHQGIFQWVSSSHQVAKVLLLQPQHQSFQWIFRVDFLYYWLVWSCSPRDSQESSATPQFKSISSSAHMTTGKTIALTVWTFVGKVMSLLFNMLSRLVIAFLLSSVF